MTKFMITLKNQQATPEEVAAEKKKIESKGGKIIDTNTLIKGFTVEYPDDLVTALASDDKLDVEADGEVQANDTLL